MEAVAVVEKSICQHCGERCKDQPVQWQGHSFCCEGCRTVFEILDDHALTDYYTLADNPGIQHTPKAIHHYDYLELEEIQEKLLHFRQDKVAGVTLYIPAIHCSSCIWLLENLGKINAHVLQAQVNFPTKEVTFHYNPQELSLKALVELLDSLGYPPEISLAPSRSKTRH